MNARLMAAITDEAIKDRIDVLIKEMKDQAINGMNCLNKDISGAEKSWLERNGYTVETISVSPMTTISYISW